MLRYSEKKIINQVNEALELAKMFDIDIIGLGEKKGVDIKKFFNEDETINEDCDLRDALRTISKVLRDKQNDSKERKMDSIKYSGKLNDASQVARLMFEVSVKQQGPEPIKIYEDCLDTVSRSYEIGKIVHKDKVKEEEFINVFYFNQVVVIMTLVVGMLINTVFCKHEEALEIQKRLINIEKEIAK